MLKSQYPSFSEPINSALQYSSAPVLQSSAPVQYSSPALQSTDYRHLNLNHLCNNSLRVRRVKKNALPDVLFIRTALYPHTFEAIGFFSITKSKLVTMMYSGVIMKLILGGGASMVLCWHILGRFSDHQGYA